MTPYRLKRHRRRFHGASHFALVPFIDMMVVLVVFLLVHTADVDILPNSKSIAIPQSISERKPSQTVVVMITRDSLFVDGRLVGTLREVAAMPGLVITPLKDALIAQNDRAYYRREELLAAYRKSALNAFADVDAALVGVTSATLQEEQQAIAAASAAEALHISEVQYKAGTADFLSVLSAQQTLYNAQDQLAQVRATRLQAIVGLFRALGGGWSAS